MEISQKIDFSTIKTFIFDLGGVIIDLDREACVRAYERLGIENANELLDNYKPNGIFLQMERGEISAQEFRNTIRHITQKAITDEEINSAHGEFLLGIPQKRKDALLALRKKYKVLALSNTSPIHLLLFVRPMLTDEFHSPEDYFDKMFLSYELKSIKPDALIFERMIELGQLNPVECLFFDDGLANVEAAKKLGFQTYHVTDDNDWVGELELMINA